VRSIGRWSLAGLVLNGVIGSGVFVQPGLVGGALGWSSVFAWILAAGFTAAMVLSFSEVASRFTSAGGAYLYTQLAFGRFAGLQMGWMTYFVRAISAAVQANLFTTYLAEFIPGADRGLVAAAITVLLLGVLAAVNVRSVTSGAGLSNVTVVVKTVPLILFGIVGIGWIATGNMAPPAVPSDPSLGGWLRVLLLLMFAYGGFESALIPVGEAKNPRKDAPFALMVGLSLVTLVYVAAQVTVLATLTDPDANNRPLAAAARVILGGKGAMFMTLAALLSTYGWLAANMLNVPRLTMSMADQGDLPSFFRRIHPVFRTPYISIIFFAVLSAVLALQAGLVSNLSLSAVSRLFTYGAVCAALPVFRAWDRDHPGRVEPPAYRAPAGNLVAMIGVGISLLLISRMTLREAATLVVVVAIATTHWASVTLRARRAAQGAGGKENVT
jgi:amino acid transporter